MIYWRLMGLFFCRLLCGNVSFPVKKSIAFGDFDGFHIATFGSRRVVIQGCYSHIQCTQYTSLNKTGRSSPPRWDTYQGKALFWWSGKGDETISWTVSNFNWLKSLKKLSQDHPASFGPAHPIGAVTQGASAGRDPQR